MIFLDIVADVLVFAVVEDVAVVVLVAVDTGTGRGPARVFKMIDLLLYLLAQKTRTEFCVFLRT
jgi:hypothetical protein